MWGVDLLIQFLSVWLGSFSALRLLQLTIYTSESRPTFKPSQRAYPLLKIPRPPISEKSQSTHNGLQGVIVVNGQLKR